MTHFMPPMRPESSEPIPTGYVPTPIELPTPVLTAEATTLVNAAKITQSPTPPGKHVVVYDQGHGT